MRSTTSPGVVAAIDWADVGSRLGPPVARVVGIVVVVLIINRLLPRLSRRFPPSLQRQVDYVAPKVVWAFGLLILLGSLGININSVLALMATIGLGAALVFTPVGQNLIAGFLAGIDDVVRDGDVVTVLGRPGRVQRKGSLSLGVEMPDGTMIYVPNTKVVDDELINHDRVDGVRIEVSIPLDGSPDRGRAVAVMHEVLDGLDWRRTDRPTAVLFTEIGSNALFYTCQLWIDCRLDEPRRSSEMRTALVDALEAAGVSVGETSNLASERLVVEHRTPTPAPTYDGQPPTTAG